MSEGERQGDLGATDDMSATPVFIAKLKRFLMPQRPSASEALSAELKLIAERDVVPRLILAEKRAGSTAENRVATAKEIHEFELFVVHESFSHCSDFVKSLREEGVSLKSLYLGLFAPAAQELGERWVEDELSFADVTIALSRIQSLMNEWQEEAPPLKLSAAERRILLASAHGEQHELGIKIVGELFRMEGWDVTGGVGLGPGQDLNGLLRSNWYSVVGLSASNEDRAQRLRDEITAIRKASQNQNIAVLVGGPGFMQHPEIAEIIGADGVSSDGATAVAVAETAITRKR